MEATKARRKATESEHLFEIGIRVQNLIGNKKSIAQERERIGTRLEEPIRKEQQSIGVLYTERNKSRNVIRVLIGEQIGNSIFD